MNPTSFVAMKDFYLNLSSKSTIYKLNTAASFTIAIRPEIKLTGSWTVALVELFLPAKTQLKAKYITANFIQLSVVGETRRPVLRVAYEDSRHIVFAPEYLPVTDQLLDTLEFEVRDDKDLLEISGETQLRLHFISWSAD